MQNIEKHSKIAVIGAGNVGATIAYTLTIQGTATEVVIVDIAKDKAAGEALDIYQCTDFTHPVNVYSGEYEDIKDADIVVLTVGKARAPGMTRTDLIGTNLNIMRSAMGEAVKYAPDAIYVVVSNPVDILTHMIVTEFDIPKHKVLGSGTALDTARLNSIIASRVKVSPQSIDAYVLGEHGETSVVPWSLSSIAGIPVEDYDTVDEAFKTAFTEQDLADMETEMRSSGARIIPLKGATYYAIASSVNYICKHVLENTNAVICISTLMEGEYDMNGVSLSIPCIVGRNGIIRTITPALTEDELKKLHASGDALKAIIKEQGLK